LEEQGTAPDPCPSLSTGNCRSSPIPSQLRWHGCPKSPGVVAHRLHQDEGSHGEHAAESAGCCRPCSFRNCLADQRVLSIVDRRGRRERERMRSIAAVAMPEAVREAATGVRPQLRSRRQRRPSSSSVDGNDCPRESLDHRQTRCPPACLLQLETPRRVGSERMAQSKKAAAVAASWEPFANKKRRDQLGFVGDVGVAGAAGLAVPLAPGMVGFWAAGRAGAATPDWTL